MPNKASLIDLLTKSSLKEYAGPVYYQRGVAYFENGAVDLRRFDEHEISARVEGTETYRVVLRAGRQLDWSCSCPLGDEGECCKHVVATGLTWLARGVDKLATQSKAGKSRKYESPDLAAIREFVARSDKQTLGDLLLKQVADDDALAARLLNAALRSAPVKPAALKNAIRNALEVDGFHDYQDSRDVVERASIAPELIRNTLDTGDAGAAAELAEYALELGFDAIEQMDDSSGGMSFVLEELCELHALACKRGGVPAKQLARSVFDLQLADPIGMISLDDYLKLLGKDGLAAYRQHAEHAWKKLSAPPERDAYDENTMTHFKITQVMKTLASIDNDVDALIEILKRDLGHAHGYLQVAQALANAKRHDEALQWAEDGRRKFTDTHHGVLDDFLIAEYHRRKRHEDAIAMRWARFEKFLNLQTYQSLKNSADKNSTWNARREKALALLHDKARKSKDHHTTWLRTGATDLIDIHLWERNAAAALEAAHAYGCSGSTWLMLAKVLESKNPDEAIRIYQAHIEPVIRRGDNMSYAEAGQLISRLHALLCATARRPQYATWLTGVRLRNKAKRNFIKVLDELVAKKKA